MKTRKFLLPLTAFALLLSFGLAACGNSGEQGGQSGDQSQEPAKQEKISVSAEGDKKNLILGETVQLYAKVGDQALEGVSWESKDATVASVSATGLVTSLKVGSTTITASKDGYKAGTINIKVDLQNIVVTAKDNKTTLVMGESVELSADQQGVTWATSDDKVATVDQNGKVTAIYVGSAVISAKKDGFNDGKITINVTRPEATATLHWEDADHYAADGEWSSSNDPYESPVYNRSSGNASDGTCCAHFGEGDIETLKFTSSAATKAELVMTIASRSSISELSEVMSAKFNDAPVTIAGEFAGGSSSEFSELSLGELDVKLGENALVLNFLSSSAPYIDDLAIYAKDAVTITLVPAPVREKIEVQDAELSVEAGKTVQIVVTKPTSLEGITFTSSDESAATVDNTGLVTGVSLGTANIIVRKEGMNAAKVKVNVTEVQQVGEIRLEAELAEEVVAGTSSFMNLTDGTSGITRPHSGGGYISGYNVSGEETLTFKFEATAAQVGKYELSVNGSPAYGATEDFLFATSTTITLNEDEVTILEAAAITAGDGGMSAPRVDATLGEVNVKLGENTLVVVFHGKAPSLDFFRLVPKA